MTAGGVAPLPPVARPEMIDAAAVFLIIMPRWAQAVESQYEAEAIRDEVIRREPSLRGRAKARQVHGQWWAYIEPEVP